MGEANEQLKTIRSAKEQTQNQLSAENKKATRLSDDLAKEIKTRSELGGQLVELNKKLDVIGREEEKTAYEMYAQVKKDFASMIAEARAGGR